MSIRDFSAGISGRLRVPPQLMRRGISGHVALLIAALALPAAAQSGLPLVVSAETAPAGAWAQIKVSLATPQQVTAGYLSIDFDPQVFGPVGNVAVLSATGDAQGFAHVAGTHVDVTFYSPSGGAGQLPGLPVFVVSVPVLPGVPSGKTTTVTVDPTGAVWSNLFGNPYKMVSAAATFRVGGTISVQSVSPAGGLMAAGTVITVLGTGFDAATTATMDGVNLSSVQYISGEQVNLTLGDMTELTAKRLHVATSSGEQLDHFLALPSVPGIASDSGDVEPLIPLTTFQTVQWYFPIAHPLSDELLGLLNQTSAPVTATFFGMNGVPVGLQTFTIPPGELYFPDVYTLISANNLWLTTSAPIRMMAYISEFEPNQPGGFVEGTFLPVPAMTIPWAAPGAGVIPAINQSWQTGTPPPPPAYTGFCNGGTTASVSVSAAAQPWLSVTQAGDDWFSLSFNVSSLAAGTYTGTVTATCALPAALSAFPVPVETLQVALNVSASPPLVVSPNAMQLAALLGGAGVIAPSPQVVTVTSSGPAAQFTASPSTSAGGNWLSVTPAQGTTPASLTIGADPTGLADGVYQGQVTIQGAGTSINVTVSLDVPYSGPPTVNLSSLSFVLGAGSPTPSNPQLLFGTATNYPVSVQTQAGGNWLTAVAGLGGGENVTTSAASLGPGTYQGTVTFTTPSGAVQVAVTLTVVGPPAAGPTVAPSSISLTAPADQSVTQTITVSSAGAPTLFTYTSSIGYVALASPSITSSGSFVVTPATLQFTIVGTPQPGTSYGNVVIAWDGGSATIPVTFTATAAPGFPPIVASVASAASGSPGAIAPGEVISVFGMGVGAAPAGLKLDASGKVSTQIGNTQILIDGVPAPLIYASANQMNAIVPYETGSGGIATLQVISNGQQSAVWQLPVAASAPALFTIGSTGVGQAAVLNQNNSVNGPSNPAARGEVVQIYATGGGQTAPSNSTGGIAGSSGDTTLLPVTVTIGGADALVTYHGSAPGEIAGLLQVNAIVPAGVTPGPAVPITFTAGGQSSQSGVTIAVK